MSRRATDGLVRTAVAVAVVAVLVSACSSGGDDSGSASVTTSTSRAEATTTNGSVVSASVGDLVLDPSHDYGDKYADGILPVGDGRYDTGGARQGYVYVCRAPAGGGGAQTRGPWFNAAGTEYDVNTKVPVEGAVRWDASFSMQVADGTRSITSNDLPRDHPTGEFPVQPADPAYQYDRNPNHIAAQSLTYDLNAEPEYREQPSCVTGEAGVMETGVALFDAFDAGGRDAGAWEVQDGCDGHPQMSSEYHYHTLSACIDDTSVSTVIGWSLDGFPITGPKVGDHNVLTTTDLDECHGITSTITIDGQPVTTYHYVMTQDFPYSISCFRSTPILPPRAS
jgi:YHYH protein